MKHRARNFCVTLALASALCWTSCTVTRSAHEPRLADDATRSPAELHNSSAPVKPSSLDEAYAAYMSGVLGEVRGDAQESEKDFSKALSLDPLSPDLVLETAGRLMDEKKYEKARDILIRATEDKGASDTLFSKLGLVYSQLGRDADAELASQTAIKKNPSNFEAYQTLFLLRTQKGRPAAALEILDEAGKCDCLNDDANLELAESYIALARQAPSLEAAIKTNALVVLKRASNAKPGVPNYRMRLGEDYLRMGGLDEASKIFLDLLDELEDKPPLRQQVRDRLVRIYMQQNDQTRAASQLLEIVKEDPSNFLSYYLLGKIADDQHGPIEALQYYSTAAALGGGANPDFYYDIARLQIDNGKPDEALATLQMVRKKFSWGFTGEILSAIACERKKDFTEAVAHFTAAEVIAKATDRSRLNASFYFDEGSAYERAGIIDQAEIFLLKSLEMNPGDAETLNYLGYMWADKGIKLEKALDAIGKALKIEPGNVAYLDSMGWVLFKMGKPTEGLVYIQQANSLSEEPDATLLEHLGDIYTALNKGSDAREAYKKSLGLTPNSEIQKKLYQLKNLP